MLFPLAGGGDAVIKLGELVMILDLHQQGLSVSAIARQLCVDRRTVRRAIAKGLEPPNYKTRAPRPRITDPFEPYLKERLAAYPGVARTQGTWIRRRLQRSQRLRTRPAAAALGRLRSPL
jgi:transposase